MVYNSISLKSKTLKKTCFQRKCKLFKLGKARAGSG